VSDAFEGLGRDRTAEARTFSWGRAAVHAGVAAWLSFLVAMMIGVALRVANPQLFGQAIGRAMPFVIGATLGISYAVQTRSWRVLAAIVLAIGVIIALGDDSLANLASTFRRR